MDMPAAGGRYTRDPVTGALAPLAPVPESSPAPDNAAPDAAPAPPANEPEKDKV